MKRVLDVLVLIPLCRSLWWAAGYFRRRAIRKAILQAMPLFVVATVMAWQPLRAATGIAPAEAFPEFPANVNLNQDFWSGWQAGMVTPIVLPDPAMLEIWDYKAAVRKSEPPSHRVGPFFVINYNVGLAQAEEQAADYFWTHWEGSCAVMVCGASPAAKRRRSLAPKQVTHLDLMEKGVKSVVKLTYRGARVIL